jgi:integrase
MASIQKTAKGFRAQIFVSGRRDSKIFRTQREAKAWAAARTTAIRTEINKTPSERHTLADAVRRYLEEVSPGKRGERWERVRLKALLLDPNFPSGEIMGDLTSEHFALWRDSRSRQVQAGTVLREISLVSALIEAARIEWRWISHNPIKEIRKPRRPDHREVVIQPLQVRELLKAMGYSPLKPVRSVAQSVAVCFLTALRTGMRAGELTGLSWDRIHADYCELPVTKTIPRKVPLTRKAVRLLKKMRGYDASSVFGLKPQTLDANFRKYRDRAGLSGFTFHDARHTAATMLARKLDVLDLCRMFGWTTTKHALIYYNPTASSIADILNRPSK